ncbi:putative transporter [Erysiphe neolycopersici]|uniref:Putative transporter n=1 Tax=Erysiphe neolycopersici TaxID=212602 RepID=A0A420HBP9_9PEZI|nr:putative transporter [Erysiphe neolycopersici]
MAKSPDIPEFLRETSNEERDALENKLKRKIDLRLIPLLVLIYIMNYLDRGNIAAAKIAGLPEDLKLKGDEYQWAVSVLFFGYLLMQVPSNLYLNKLGKPSIYLPTCMLIWGLISTCMAASQNFRDLLICRLFLGFAEAAYFPGCLFYLSCWYTRSELTFRTAIFFSGSIISGAVSGLVSSGISAKMDGLKGLRAWRWLFILEGIATMLVATLSFFILPDLPRTTSFLSTEERELALWRLEKDIGEESVLEDNNQSFLSGAIQAAKDIKVYVLMLLVHCIAVASSVVTYFPSLVKTLNYSRAATFLLTVPPFALAVLTTYFNAWHAVPMAFAFAAFVVNILGKSNAIHYFSLVLMLPGIFSGQVIALSWVSNCIPNPPAKRAAALGFISTISNSALIYTSFMYYDAARPRYLLAMTFNASMLIVGVFAAIAMRIILSGLNKNLEDLDFEDNSSDSPITRRQIGFRYII